MSPPSLLAVGGGVQAHGQQDGQKAHEGGEQCGGQHELAITALLQGHALLEPVITLERLGICTLRISYIYI